MLVGHRFDTAWFTAIVLHLVSASIKHDIIHLQWRISFYSRLNACNLLYLLPARTDIYSVLLKTLSLLWLDGYLVTCFGMEAFIVQVVLILQQALHHAISKALIKPIIPWVFCLLDSAMRRQKVFYDWHPIFFLIAVFYTVDDIQYPSGFAAIGYSSLGVFWALYTFPPLKLSYSACWGS